MRRRIIAIPILFLLQFLLASAFTFASPHLAQIWYKHGIGWWEAIKAEHTQGGYIMIVEFAVIVVAFIGTIIFSLWLLFPESKAEKQNSAILIAIAKKLGVSESEIESAMQNKPTAVKKRRQNVKGAKTAKKRS